VLQDRDATRVLARVSDEQRSLVRRRSLAVANNTSVVVVVDPAYGKRSQPMIGTELPNGPVRVRVVAGPHEGIELIVRRQDLTYSTGPADRVAALLPFTILMVILTAGAYWSIETIGCVLTYRRQLSHEENRRLYAPTAESQRSMRARGPRIFNRGESECEQWRASVAAMTARRKVRCASRIQRPLDCSML
jgi:hypothetical protein